MKTTLIQIDPHDDLTSIKDKMTWAKSPRMLLFFPHGYPVDQSPLTMKLIRRYAETNGSRVALITRDRMMREIAEEQEIPCFTSAPQAEKKSWGTAESRKPLGAFKGIEKISAIRGEVQQSPKSSRFSLAQKFISITLLIGIGVISSLFFIPSATVTVYPVLIDQVVDYQVVLDPNVTEVGIAGVLPAGSISIEVSGELSVDSTGKVVVPKTKATGEITITNLTTKRVLIPRGTVVSTGGLSPVEFYLTSEVSLAAVTGAQTAATIEAVNVGESGNVANGMVTLIGGLDNVVSINNSEPTSGGTEQSFPTPAEGDYKILQDKLHAQLISDCNEKILGESEEGTILIGNSIKLGQEISRNEIPSIGEPSDRATLTLTMSCSAITYTLEDEKMLAKIILDQNLGNRLKPLNDIIQTKQTSGATVVNVQSYTWKGHASRLLMPSFEKQDLLSLISGKPIEEAKNFIFQAFEQEKAPVVVIAPVWWSRLPWLPNRIKLEIGGK